MLLAVVSASYRVESSRGRCSSCEAVALHALAVVARGRGACSNTGSSGSSSNWGNGSSCSNSATHACHSHDSTGSCASNKNSGLGSKTCRV